MSRQYSTTDPAHAARRSSDRCECGHARARHFYGRRTRRWWSCMARPLGVSGRQVAAATCECKEFRKKVAG